MTDMLEPIDWLRDRVEAYFEAHDINVPVLYGVEQDYRDPDTPSRVVIGEGEGFDLVPAGPSGAPGHREVSPGFSARSILTDRQSFVIIVRTTPPAGVADSDRVRVSKRLAKRLLYNVLRAIHKVAHGPYSLNINGKGRWLKIDELDEHHGAALQVTGSLDSPVDDLERPRLGLARASLDATKVNLGLDLEACNSEVCEPAVTSPTP